MFSRAVCVLAVAALVVGCASSSASPAPNPTVRTDAGVVRGAENQAVRTFQGIPYARPPIGDLRWRPPRPPQPWSGVRAATAPSAACPQQAGQPDSEPNTSEDCLYLNVTTPTHARGGPLPVMVWIHGGGFTNGSGASYNADQLADQGNVMVVTVNYRLGVFGYFSHPRLGSDSGDYGLEDQVAALNWVRHNATAFGGDPRNLTLFGESAGGFSTCALLTSGKVTGLVNRAIIESGSCSDFLPKNGLSPGVPADPLFAPLSQIQDQGEQAAAQLGCANTADVLGCLRAKPTKSLASSEFMSEFSFPAYDSTFLPEEPGTALRAGKLPPVPIMVGNTNDEMRLYVAVAILTGTTYDLPRYHQLMTDSYGAQAPAVEGAYPPGPTPATAWAAALTDQGLLCSTTGDQQALADHGHDVYGFVFADEHAPILPDYPNPPNFPVGAMHSSELSYLFGPPSGSAQQRQLSTDMVGYWTNFAHTGNPNGPSLPTWKPFQTNKTVQQLAPGPGGIAAIDPATTHHCDLWATI
ncbi:MAG TPA: carboxylesterase family protein [Pseudonocardiaceae bacterium]